MKLHVIYSTYCINILILVVYVKADIPWDSALDCRFASVAGDGD